MPPTPVISYELEGGLDYVVGEMPVVVAGICQLRSVIEAFDGNKAAFQNLIRGLNPSQRSALIQGIAEIADLTKRKDFIKAFVADANFAQGIGEDASLIKTWESIYQTNSIIPLQAAKRLKSQNLIFNGKFDIINNPGCIGHLSADVERLLLDSGWAIDIANTNNSISSFKRLTGVVENNGYAHFEVFQFNHAGQLHAINPSQPCTYWKLLKDGYSNNKAVYRSTIDSNFGANISDITIPIFRNGIKIN